MYIHFELNKPVLLVVQVVFRPPVPQTVYGWMLCVLVCYQLLILLGLCSAPQEDSLSSSQRSSDHELSDTG